MRPTASAFVGRGRELELLGGALGAAAGGEPRVVLVEGPPGIGKTALLRRFLAEAGDGVRVLRATGEETESLLAYGVAEQLMRSARLRMRDPALVPDDRLVFSFVVFALMPFAVLVVVGLVWIIALIVGAT